MKVVKSSYWWQNTKAPVKDSSSLSQEAAQGKSSALGISPNSKTKFYQPYRQEHVYIELYKNVQDHSIGNNRLFNKWC